MIRSVKILACLGVTLLGLALGLKPAKADKVNCCNVCYIDPAGYYHCYCQITSQTGCGDGTARTH